MRRAIAVVGLGPLVYFSGILPCLTGSLSSLFSCLSPTEPHWRSSSPRDGHQIVQWHAEGRPSGEG